MYMDGRSATIGAAFSVTPVLVIATGVYSPHELHNFLYEGEWDLQLKLGANWGKILKVLKGSSKAGPAVNAVTRVARSKLAGTIQQLRRQGKTGKDIGRIVSKAARLSPDEWADMRTAFKSIVGLVGTKKGKQDPKVDVLEIPFIPIPGVALAVAKMLAEVKILNVSRASRDPEDPEVGDGSEWDD